MNDFDDICNKTFEAEVFIKTQTDDNGRVKKFNDISEYYKPIEQQSVEELAAEIHEEQTKDAIENSEDQKDDDIPF